VRSRAGHQDSVTPTGEVWHAAADACIITQMLRSLIKGVAALLLTGALACPLAAQPAGEPDPSLQRRPPAPEYALVGLATLVLLVIVCMPTRKG